MGGGGFEAHQLDGFDQFRTQVELGEGRRVHVVFALNVNKPGIPIVSRLACPNAGHFTANPFEPEKSLDGRKSAQDTAIRARMEIGNGSEAVRLFRCDVHLVGEIVAEIGHIAGDALVGGAAFEGIGHGDEGLVEEDLHLVHGHVMGP